MWKPLGIDIELYNTETKVHYDEMQRGLVEIGRAVPLLAGVAAERFARALSFLHAPEPFDEAEAMALVAEAVGTRVA